MPLATQIELPSHNIVVQSLLNNSRRNHKKSNGTAQCTTEECKLNHLQPPSDEESEQDETQQPP
jgi:hypothetical protein